MLGLRLQNINVCSFATIFILLLLVILLIHIENEEHSTLPSLKASLDLSYPKEMPLQNSTSKAPISAVSKLRQNSKTKPSYNMFNTAFGNVGLSEIVEKVYEKFGYTFWKNDLIPIIKNYNTPTCDAILFEWQRIATTGFTLNPPKEMPNQKEFLMNGYALSETLYFNDTPKNSNESIRIWSEEYINNLIAIGKKNPYDLPRLYHKQSFAVYAATKHFGIRGKVGAAIGSQLPWSEVYSLINGAKHVTTVDNQKINISHPQMNFLYSLDLADQREKYYDSFDFVISFSSIEHSGLGRYGDPINPIGDILEMNKIRCLLKIRGLLFLGFAIGTDSVVFNAHRIYGRIRLAMMFEGFQLLKVFFSDKIVSDQHMLNVFQKSSWNGQYLFVLQRVE